MEPSGAKLVLVTGAARGLGLAIAKRFAASGVAVALCDVLEAEGLAAAEEMNASGQTARFFRLDVSDAGSWEDAVSSAIVWQGRVDVLVNNAGIVKRRNIATYSEKEWRHLLDVNLTGSFLGIKTVSTRMIAQGGGAIVNIGSNTAFSAHPDIGYAVSKWGIRGLTKSAAMELATSGIRVNCVCPGPVLTDINRNGPHLAELIGLTPLSRAVEPDEVAAAVAFLASDDARMITGEEILVDGGFTAGGSYWRVGRNAGFYDTAEAAR